MSKDINIAENAYYELIQCKIKIRELEKAIATDAGWSYSYAANELEGRFIIGEDIISKSAKYSYYYIINVIKDMWEKGHNSIMQDELYKKKYIHWLNREFIYGRIKMSNNINTNKDFIDSDWFCPDDIIMSNKEYAEFIAREVLSPKDYEDFKNLNNCMYFLDEHKKLSILSVACIKASRVLEIDKEDMSEIIGVPPYLIDAMGTGLYSIKDNDASDYVANLFLRAYKALNRYAKEKKISKKKWLRKYSNYLKGIPLQLMKTKKGLLDVVLYLETFL